MWNGRPVLVTLSDESSTGFLNVLKQPGARKKPFYAKFQPEGETKQRHLPGSSSTTAWEAACKLGYYEATKEPLPEVIPLKGKRRPTEVRTACSLFLCCACSCVCCAPTVQEVQAEKEAKRLGKEAKKLARRAAALPAVATEAATPVAPCAAVPMTAHDVGLPVAVAVPMRATPVAMPNLAPTPSPLLVPVPAGLSAV